MKLLTLFSVLLLTSCGFKLQGQMPLAPQLHHVYLQTSDPYGQLARHLQQYLHASKVQLATSPADASAILNILSDTTSQDLLSVSGTQQTRQYNIHVNVTFEVLDPAGRVLVAPQTITETRTITIQSNQILGSSNETSLYYQQMRRTIAYSIMNRLASKQTTEALAVTFPTKSRQKP